MPQLGLSPPSTPTAARLLALLAGLLGACGAEEVYVPVPLASDTGGDGGGAEGCSDPSASVGATMQVHNGSAETVRVIWVDSTCVEQPYGSLKPDQAYDQPTFLGHYWRFVGQSSGVVLAELRVDEDPEIVELQP